MQTFAPFTNNARNALVLDMKRLGKQRVESKQLLQAALDIDKHGQPGNTGQAYANHPIHHMWLGYEEALLSYTWEICTEWVARGYRDGIRAWLLTAAHARGFKVRSWDKVEHPWWWGNPRVHVLHRANLLVKDPVWYTERLDKLGMARWDVPKRYQQGFGYYWPLSAPSEASPEGEWKLIRRDSR